LAIGDGEYIGRLPAFDWHTGMNTGPFGSGHL